MRSLTAIVAAALLCIAVDGQTFGVNDEDLKQCIKYMICDSDKVPELRDMARLLKPKTMDHMLQVTRDLYDWKDFNDDDASWAKLKGKYCPLSEERKTELSKNYAMDGTEFMGKICEGDDEEECDAIENAMSAFSKMVAELFATGECGPQAKALKAVKLPGFGR